MEFTDVPFRLTREVVDPQRRQGRAALLDRAKQVGELLSPLGRRLAGHAELADEEDLAGPLRRHGGPVEALGRAVDVHADRIQRVGVVAEENLGELLARVGLPASLGPLVPRRGPRHIAGGDGPDSR